MRQVSRWHGWKLIFAHVLRDRLRVGEDELEVEVLRIAMLRENWQCLAEDESPVCVADTSEVLPELSAAPRPGPAKMAGPWKVFDVAAVPVPDEAAIGDSPAPTSTCL